MTEFHVLDWTVLSPPCPPFAMTFCFSVQVIETMGLQILMVGWGVAGAKWKWFLRTHTHTNIITLFMDSQSVIKKHDISIIIIKLFVIFSSFSLWMHTSLENLVVITCDMKTKNNTCLAFEKIFIGKIKAFAC